MIGCHISHSAHGGVLNGCLIGMQIGATAIQLNLSPPSNWSLGKSLTEKDIKSINDLRTSHGLYIVVHGKYLYNFCRKTEQQSQILLSELASAALLNADLVIHQGKNVPELKISHEMALKNFVDGITQVLRKSPETNRVLLENSCKQGTECGYTIEELSKILEMFPEDVQHRVGICFDTCHGFVSGELDIRVPEQVKLFFENFDRLIGLERLKVIHLNDSAVKFAGCNDHHANLLNGFITSESSVGMKTFVKHAYNYGIPMILETPNGYHIDEIKILRKWAESPTDASESELELKHKSRFHT